MPKKSKKRIIKPVTREARNQTGANAIRGIFGNAKYVLSKAQGVLELARDAYTPEQWNMRVDKARELALTACSHLERAKHNQNSWSRDRNRRTGTNGQTTNGG